MPTSKVSPVFNSAYFHKYEKLPTENPLWNIPETKQGSINVVGGHAGSFRTVVKTAEFLTKRYPLQEVKVVLPDALAEKVPKLPNFNFLHSTESGSFRDGFGLAEAYSSADFSILIGDFSKNEITKKALENSLTLTEASVSQCKNQKLNLKAEFTSVSNSELVSLAGPFFSERKGQLESAVSNSEKESVVVDARSREGATAKAPQKPLLITRDTVDLLATETASSWLQNENITILASLAQLQKLFRAIYYPKMLLLSQSLLQVSEALHKFTLSYPVSVVTLHDGKIIIAKAGEIAAVDLEKSGYSPFLFWNGEIAAKIAAMNLYNPQDFINATLAAIFAE